MDGSKCFGISKLFNAFDGVWNLVSADEGVAESRGCHFSKSLYQYQVDTYAYLN